MKKYLNYIGLFLFFFALFLVGVFFIDSILRLANYPYDLILALGMSCGFIYLYRNEKDSIVGILKDVHQSNLDYIESQKKDKPNWFR
jgi:hypothetical protein